MPLSLRSTALLTLLSLAACVGAEAQAGDPSGAPAEMASAARDAPGRNAGDDSPPALASDAVAPVLAVAVAHAGPEPTRPAQGAAAGEPEGTRVLPPPVPLPEHPPVFTRPEHVRGIYLNKWVAGSPKRVDQLIGLARRTEVNAFVIDLKDASGYLSYASGVPLAREIGALDKVSIDDLPGLLKRLQAEGIWPIARIVVVKDPPLAAARPDLTVQDTAGGPWVDGHGTVWMNAYHREVWAYDVALAREAAKLGFPEIQWDYVRFPDAPRAEMARATFPDAEGRTKPEAIRGFLAYARAALDSLGVAMTADVFGVTTSARDVGIGQVWERFIDEVDAAQPMVYPSHYWRGSFGFQEPNAHPYEIVTNALERGLRRSKEVEGAGAIRPWLQDFSLGSPDYGAPEVRAQIQAARDLGIEEWLLWNPAGHYTEAALEPADGWRREPLVRVADRVVPVSERKDALELAERQAREAARDSALAADTARAGTAPSREAVPAVPASTPSRGDSLEAGGR